MPALLQVLIVVQLLLGCAQANEFGYQPSVEEFDSLLRNTQLRSWTRNLLAGQRRNGDAYFVPRYQQELPSKAGLHFQLFSDDDDDDDVDDAAHQVDQQQQQQHEQQLPFYYNQAGAAHVQSPVLHISDSSNHNAQTADTSATSWHKPLATSADAASTFSSATSAAAAATNWKKAPIATKPAAAAAAPAASITTATSSLDSSSFPIYFSNPATGVIYAISEVKTPAATSIWQPDDSTNNNNNNHNNNDIAIYVSKAQYDADLRELQQRYEQQCSSSSSNIPRPIISSSSNIPRPISSNNHKPISSSNSNQGPISSNNIPRPISSSSNNIPRPISSNGNSNQGPISSSSNTKPQIIRVPPPTRKQSAVPAASNKLPTPPLKVYSNLGNITKLSKPPKPKRAKRKKKKKLPKRRPGHRHSEQSAAPSIVLGKRSNSSSSSSSSGTTRSPLPNLTQLEKPHMPATSATIFSEEPFVRSQGVLQLPRLQRQRRALPTPTAAARPVSSGRRRSGGGGGGGRRRSSNNGRVPRRGKSAAPPPPVDSKTPSSGYKVPLAVHLLHPKRNQSHAARRRSGEGFDLFEFIGGEDEEEEDAEESAYYDEPATSAAKPENSSSSAEEEADFGALEPNSSTIAAPLSSTENVEREQLPSKKRIRRRPVRRPDRQNAAEYYDDDDDIDVVDESEEEYKDADNDSDSDSMSDSSFGNFFRMLFYPMQLAMTRLYDGLTGQSEEEPTLPDKPKYPTYTLYHSAHSNEALLAEKQQPEEDEDDDDSSLSSWFSSWFGLRRRNKRIDSNAVVALPTPTPTPEPEPSWFESWFGFGKTTASTETEEEAEEQDDYDKWFAGWFESTPKPKSRRRKATTTTTTTSSTTSTTTLATPQVPILTIVDPMRNPQNWIGILAHHIVNSTANGAAQIATSTINPLKQLVSQAPAVATAEDKRISYDKYQIWRLKPQDEPQVRALEQFKKGEDGNKLQWLKGPSLRGLTDVLVPPKMLVDFQGTLNFEGIAHEVLIFDVGKAIAYERNKEAYMLTTPAAVRRRPVKQQAQVAATMSWNKYHEHDDILKYLETLRMRHAQLVELIHIGRSYEGRPLLVVKIESKQLAAAAIAAAASSHKRLKHKRRSGQANAVFIEAGAQAMAWIGPASATWMISELVRLMRSNKTDEQHEFIRNTTWYIMPVLNPDGYVYSHEYDRFWKKSRSQHAEKPPSGLLDSAMTWLQQKRANAKNCFGVDLDRNWLYQWGKRGSSKTPCNEFYAGPAPFSEPETKAVSEFLMDYRTQIKLYISLQAYGQVLSYPIKANSTFNTERLDDFLDVAMVGTDVLRKKGSKTRYKVDSANDLIEQRSGCADAFAAYEIGIPFSYTLQLADNGVHGYLLPSSAIESTARDAFEIIGGMLDYI